ncbi:hypothetical protein LCGC14_2031470 [marine sediment metagenome]|uniref:Uncharacterized protein n=1 Tax=marine sediment metagenome TaxID=412755 RepID=A0A0F9EUN1_9ZZZZ
MKFPIVRRSTYVRVLVELADVQKRAERLVAVIAEKDTILSRWRLEQKARHEKT